MIIAIDFDGTCVTHEYPEIGQDIGADTVINALVEAGHKIILWTMRSGPFLEDAVKWCEHKGIPLFGVNTNPDQASWTGSPKAYAQLYIDDAALGIPLVKSMFTERPYVDWERVQEILEKKGILP